MLSAFTAKKVRILKREGWKLWGLIDKSMVLMGVLVS